MAKPVHVNDVNMGDGGQGIAQTGRRKHGKDRGEDIPLLAMAVKSQAGKELLAGCAQFEYLDSEVGR